MGWDGWMDRRMGWTGLEWTGLLLLQGKSQGVRFEWWWWWFENPDCGKGLKKVGLPRMIGYQYMSLNGSRKWFKGMREGGGEERSTLHAEGGRSITWAYVYGNNAWLATLASLRYATLQYRMTKDRL